MHPSYALAFKQAAAFLVHSQTLAFNLQVAVGFLASPEASGQRGDA